MSSKWFNQYCKLNRHDQNMICDRLVNVTNMRVWANIYGSVVFEEKLSMFEVERLIHVFKQDRRSEDIRTLLIKLERLRSQC